MKQEDEYLQYLKECWVFANNAASGLIGQEHKMIRLNLTLSIFDKCCSPYHYFLQDTGQDEASVQPPTEKQIAYAKQLGIQDLEQYSKQQLSEEIDKVVRSKKK